MTRDIQPAVKIIFRFFFFLALSNRSALSTEHLLNAMYKQDIGSNRSVAVFELYPMDLCMCNLMNQSEL